MKTLFTYMLKHKFLLFLIIGVITGGIYFSNGKKVSLFETTAVKRVAIVQEVSVTGRVNSETLVDLAFERGGRVVGYPAPVGAPVAKGSPLVRLDNAELVASRAQAQANLDYEKANLSQLENGSRREDIAITEASYESAAGAMRDAQFTLLDKLSSASTAADDAIFNKTDYLFDNPRTINPRALFFAADQQLVTKLEQARAALTQELKEIALGNTEVQVGLSVLLHKKYFINVKNYLDDLATAINAALPSSQATQTTIDTWKASVSLARTNVNTAVSALLGAEQAYSSAGTALTVAENQLKLKRAGPTTDALLAQKAKIAAGEASVANYDAQIAKMLLSAPFAGVITKQDAKVGQTVSPNTTIVSLMSDGQWKIEANVPEVDVAKIKVGDVAKVTLDAYGSDVKFDAVVSLIDPAETILEGVSTYKITLHFNGVDERIRSGMTANINIATNKREGVLAVPLRAVSTKDGKKYVRILLVGDVASENEVELGLRGSDGLVEILSGLSEGETVITFEKTP